MDGQPLSVLTSEILPTEPVREVDLQRETGESLHIELGSYPIAESPMKVSLWALGGMFAIIGAIVLLRRPDLHAARMFGLFAGANALALTVAPSSGGPAPAWSLFVQALMLIAVGASFLPFVLALVYEHLPSRLAVLRWIIPTTTALLVSGYLASVFAEPSFFEIVRPVVLLFVASSVLTSITLLAFRAFNSSPVSGKQSARVALLGMALGTLPFISLTVVPGALGQDPLLPNHITILAWGFIPVAFAYAIFQYQLLGIRRLIHRGMVHAIVSFALLILIVGILALAASWGNGISGLGTSLAILSLLTVGGVLIFPTLRRITYGIIDALLYRDDTDYQAVLVDVQQEIGGARVEPDVETNIARRLVEALNLESVLIILGDESRPPVMAGDKADHVLEQILPFIDSNPSNNGSASVTELLVQGDFVLVCDLVSSGQNLGFMALGPKVDGESFVDEEKLLVATLSPLLALAFEKDRLSQELRGVNQRLVDAGEDERGRIAGDLHDGPLQKAILLGQEPDLSMEDRGETLRQLVSELREIGSRLRPSILDDLGVGPALEWLVEGQAVRAGLKATITLEGFDDDERFNPEAELALFRVTQESLNNVVKHARATHIEVSLSKSGDVLFLKVVDDGAGFHREAGRPQGFGLSGMRERMLQVNGRLDIHSSPGAGTTVTASLPITY